MSRRLSVAYMALQAGMALGWWVALVVSDRVRGWFELDAGEHDVLSAFVLADLLVIVAGSAVAALALARSWSWASSCVAWVAGGVAYATLYLAMWTILGGHGAAGLAPMAGATVLTSGVAIRETRDAAS
jgi:hypothetical protein